MKRIAIVAPNLEKSGGVKSVVKFLLDGFDDANTFEVELVSLATSYKDTNSSRFINPLTWFKHPKVTKSKLFRKPMWLVGCHFIEYEPNRYKPRRVLTKLLDEYDIVQLVSGVPAWALTCTNTRAKVLLQTATLTSLERKAKARSLFSLKEVWSRLMTGIIAEYDRKGLMVAEKVFVENYIMRNAVAKEVPSKMIFAPPGIEVEPFLNEKSKNDLVGHPYFLTVGRLGEPRKDFEMAVKAYSKFLSMNKTTGMKFVIAGRGTISKDVLRLIEKNDLKNKVMIIKDLSLSDLIAIYKNAFCFLLSSKEEGLGMVIMEAMASGLPVIATDCGGPEVLVEDGINGYLVPVGAYEELGERMHYLYRHNEIREKISNVNESKGKTFDFRIRFKKYLNEYVV